MKVELTCLSCGAVAQPEPLSLPLCLECRKAAQPNASGVKRERPSQPSPTEAPREAGEALGSPRS